MKKLFAVAILAVAASASAQQQPAQGQQEQRQVTMEEVNALISAMEIQRNAALNREAQLMQQNKLLQDELQRRRAETPASSSPRR